MQVTNAINVFLLLATSFAIAMAQNETNFGADDVARESDLLALKEEVSQIKALQNTLQFKADSMIKMLQSLTSTPQGIAPEIIFQNSHTPTNGAE